MTTIKGLDALNRKLKRLEDFQRVMTKPAQESGAILVDYLAKAPRKSAGAFSRLATPAQRRAYWAKVRSGEADHSDVTGYRRSSTLVRGWNHKVKRYGQGIRVEVGNKKGGAYGIYVQGSRQQPFHEASGWRTTDEALEKNMGKIQDKFERVIKRELNR